MSLLGLTCFAAGASVDTAIDRVHICPLLHAVNAESSNALRKTCFISFNLPFLTVSVLQFFCYLI